MQHAETSSSQQAPSALSSGDIIANKYKVADKIGGGAFGVVYRAIHLRTGRSVAVKVATKDDDISMLEIEAHVYRGIHNTSSEIIGISELKYFQKDVGRALLVMDLLGPSLHSISKRRGGRLSLKSVLMVGIQLLRRLQLIHHKGFIHRDVKPDNMLIGKTDTSRVYLVDFGVSRQYRDYDDRIHMRKKLAKTIIGSIPYISVHAHRGLEQSRRDDLESLAYSLVCLYRGSLPWQEFEIRLFPWQNPKDISEMRLYKLIGVQKMKTTPEVLCNGMPAQMEQLVRYVRALKFDERPDYVYLRGLLRSALTQNGFSEDRVFEWSRREKSAER